MEVKQTKVSSCIEIIMGLEIDAVDAMSQPAIERIVQRVFDGDEGLSDLIVAKPGEPLPNGPVYLFVQEIIVYATAIYAVYDFINKFHKVTKLIDRNEQLQIVEETIKKLRLFGLEAPASKLEEVVHKVLDRITKP